MRLGGGVLEAVMQKVLLLIAAFTGASLIGAGSSRAYEGPWCAMEDTGTQSVSERCSFRDFESCRLEIVSGNRGYCNQNPRWSGDASLLSPRKREPRRRARD
jgi:hypothetical protein